MKDLLNKKIRRKIRGFTFIFCLYLAHLLLIIQLQNSHKC
jgi:hypothetical protein